MTTQSESIFSLATHKNRVFSRSSQPLHPSKYIHVIPFVDPFDTGAPPEVVDIFLEESEGPRSTPFEASTATNTYGHNVLKPLNSNLPSQSIYSFFQEASIFEPSCAHEELAAIIKDAESRERASNRISKNRKPIFEKFKSEDKKCKGDSLNLLQRKAGKNGVTKPRLSKRGTKISDDRKIRDISECFEGMVIEDIDMVKTCKEAHALDRAKQSSERSELVNMMRLVSLPDKGFEGMVCENNNGVVPESELQMDILIV